MWFFILESTDREDYEFWCKKKLESYPLYLCQIARFLTFITYVGTIFNVWNFIFAIYLTLVPKHFFVFKAECEIIACQFYFFISKKDIIVFPKGLQNPTLGFVTPNTVAYMNYFLLIHSTISLTQRSTHQLL